MISEGSCDTHVDAENSALIRGVNCVLNIKTEKNIFDYIHAAMVSLRDFQNIKKKILLPLNF